MATKPLTTPEIWASNALYTTGPFIGSASKVVPPGAAAAEGHRPGNLFPTPAEYENSQQNEITTWIADWVYFGSSTGAIDAHIVETNASGRAQVNSLTVSNVDATQIAQTIASTANLSALSITSATTTSPVVLVTNTVGAICYAAAMGNDDGWGFSASTGNSAFPIGFRCDMTQTGAGGVGVKVTANNTTSGKGIDVDHAGSGTSVDISNTGTGTALVVTGNSSIIAATITAGAGQVALQATSGSNGATAVAAIGSGTALGLEAAGGNGSSAATAVRGTAVHADAVGVYGRTSTSASTTAAGVVGEGRGTDCIGVKAVAAAGYALWIEGDVTSPTTPAVYLKPQGAPSNSPSIGDLYCNSGMRQVKHGTGNQYVSFYQGGQDGASACLTNFSATGPFTSNSTVIWTTCLSPYLSEGIGNGYFGVGSGAEVTVIIVINPRTQTAANATLSLQVLDNSDGGNVIFSRAGTGTGLSAGYRLLSSTTNWLGSITVAFQYAPPNEGDLNLQIDIRVGDGGGANIEVRDVGCQIWGAFVP